MIYLKVLLIKNRNNFINPKHSLKFNNNNLIMSYRILRSNNNNRVSFILARFNNPIFNNLIFNNHNYNKVNSSNNLIKCKCK